MFIFLVYGIFSIWAKSELSFFLVYKNMGNELLRIADVLDKSGQYSLSDKLFKISQNNFSKNNKNKFINIIETNAPIVSAGIDKILKQIKQSEEYEKVTKLNTVLQVTPKVNKILGNSLGGINVLQLLVNGKHLLDRIDQEGFMAVWNTDAKLVLDTILSLLQLATNPNKHPLFLVLGPGLKEINMAINVLQVSVLAADYAGTIAGNTNASLFNYKGQDAKSSVLPLDVLASTYGEVYNVLIDYVNGRGTVQKLITKHIPDNNPEKLSLVNAHIAQKVLPPKDAPYGISSYKKQRDELAVSSQFGGF
jgi:hypothetical protein